MDKALLTKTTPLTGDEKQMVQKHVDHAGDILRQIDFELPVFEAVYQMNESLDGYPQGVAGRGYRDAGPTAERGNSFCAMIRPRAYRPARIRKWRWKTCARPPAITIRASSTPWNPRYARPEVAQDPQSRLRPDKKRQKAHACSSRMGPFANGSRKPFVGQPLRRIRRATAGWSWTAGGPGGSAGRLPVPRRRYP